jgi:transcriptional regulator with XRE-family HTH domain
VVRRRDWLIDKKIGAVIRMRRVKLGLSQSDLGNALRVSFQQIQKYENGTNAVASTRISDLCRALEMTPNDLFGVSPKMDGDISKLSSWTMRVALRLEDASPPCDKRSTPCSTRRRGDEVNSLPALSLRPE